jgi:hypothetical protein
MKQNPRVPVLAVLFALATALAWGASCTEEALADPGVQGAAEEGAKTDPPRPPPRPPRCEDDDDCAACPSEAGYACRAAPDGTRVCLPLCAVDSDCPRLEGVPPLSCRDGVCVPPPPPPRPPACEADADCAGCPFAGGCGCRPTPDGTTVCLPLCATDADCPHPDGMPPLACHDGACVPPGPPPPPPPRS